MVFSTLVSVYYIIGLGTVGYIWWNDKSKILSIKNIINSFQSDNESIEMQEMDPLGGYIKTQIDRDIDLLLIDIIPKYWEPIKLR